jgi:predicted RNA-binding protein with PUA-like domain
MAGKASGKIGYWLIKSEPDVFSIEALRKSGKTHWEGVRNYQARNHLRAMQLGDLVLYYHSNADPPGVAGVARVCREAYTDDAQFDAASDYYDPKSSRDEPRWSMVDVEFVEVLPELVPLDTLKADASLEGMLVIKRGMRLSVQPVEAAHFKRVLKLGKSKLKA